MSQLETLLAIYKGKYCLKKSARFARKESLILKGKSMFLIMFRAKREENFELLRISKGKLRAFCARSAPENFWGFQG